MTIAGVASAFPKHKYDQSVLLSALQRHWGPKVDNPVFMERLQGAEMAQSLAIQTGWLLLTWAAAHFMWKRGLGHYQAVGG